MIGASTTDIAALVRAAPTIHDTADVLDALETLRASPVDMAFVVDEHGTFEGVVTAADLLEAIAGQFADRPEAEPAVVQREALDPAIQGDVVDLDTPVGKHGLEVAVADRELQVPAHRPQDHPGREAEATERPGLRHEGCSPSVWRRERRSYPLTGRRSTQRIPRTASAAELIGGTPSTA